MYKCTALNRCAQNREILDSTIIPLYKQLLAEESKHANSKDGMAAGEVLTAANELSKQGVVLGDEMDKFIVELKKVVQVALPHIRHTQNSVPLARTGFCYVYAS